MLVVKRRVGERIVIGGSIKVVVLDVRGASVKLGIEAPDEVAINRPDLREGSSKLHARKKHAVAEEGTMGEDQNGADYDDDDSWHDRNGRAP